MGFLDDAKFYNSGNECPEEFVEWSALTVISAIAGRKLWVQHGEFSLFPNIYVILVAEAAGGKSTARNFAKKMVRLVEPDFTISASFQSHQDIIDVMGNMMPLTWEDSTGEGEGSEVGKIYEYRPFLISANEFKSLLSTDAKGMIELLVDIYDENEFSTGFKTYKKNNPERKQSFENPYLIMLACGVPKWFMSELKMDLFDGGLGRRLLIIFAEKSRLVDTPVRPAGADEALKRMHEFLLQLKTHKGEIKRTPEAMKFWKEWYYDPERKKTDDPILKQFLDNKHVPLLKLSTLLALSENPVAREITKDHLVRGIALLSKLEKGVSRLTRGVGRNELSGIGTRILEFITKCDGVCSRIQLLKVFNREMRSPEFTEQMNHYLMSEQLLSKIDAKTGKEFYCIPELWEEYQRKQTIAAQSAPASSASVSPGSVQPPG